MAFVSRAAFTAAAMAVVMKACWAGEKVGWSPILMSGGRGRVTVVSVGESSTASPKISSELESSVASGLEVSIEGRGSSGSEGEGVGAGD